MTELLLRGRNGIRVTPADAGWDYISFSVDRLAPGQQIAHEADGEEFALVPLSGTARGESGQSSWTFGGRASVFSGLPEVLYLPAGTAWTLTAESPLEVAVCSAPADRGQREPVLATAQDYEIEVRGAGNATRRVVTPLGPNFDAHRLVVVEVWTPAGNWSSYPPHKHDETRQPDEVALEETFFFKVSTADGFALQRLYSEERSFDMTWAVGDGDLLLVPWGYHTTVAAPGHDLYYLNVLAGDARELRPFEDPAYAPIREAWRFEEPDPRVVSAATREATRR